MPRTALLIAVMFLMLLLALRTPVRSAAVVATTVNEAPTRFTVAADPSVIVGPPKVKLAVMVYFDQMRGDYIQKWKPHFPPGGFLRMMDDGAWYSKCHYAYATTTTGPGHASLLAGAPSAVTGIINNEWYDRDSGAQVYCATSDRYENVGGTSSTPAKKPRVDTSAKKPKGGGTPDRLLAPSIADQVKASARGGKVFGLSMKDRSAIFPAGHDPDGAYWHTAEFITSSYYRDSLPAWVRDFNRVGLAKKWYGKSWDKFRKDLDYNAICGPSIPDGKANRAGLGLKFPHPITGGKATFTNNYYEALTTSPFGNELLLEFAKACIQAEQLGQRDATDFLSVSFSSNDYVGHAFGPDSQEVFDITLRSDRIMADLLSYLDTTIGKDQYCVVLSADHGICPIPEASVRNGLDAKRTDIAGMMTGAERKLQAAFGKPIGARTEFKPVDDTTPRGNFNQWIEAVPAPWVYLNQRQIEARNLDPAVVADTLASYLRTLPSVARVYTRAQLEGDTDGDEIDRLVKASDHPGRAGDLYVLLKPLYLFSSTMIAGTTHGTPYEYDRHVPFMVMGPGVNRGEHIESVAPQSAAAVMAHFLGVKPPSEATFDVPPSLFTK